MLRKALSTVLFCIMLSALSACSADTPTWQEQYDLGVRYLSEGNYEEAIIAFTAAIEIDPKRPEAYAGAADVYEVLGDMEQRKAILEKGIEATGDTELMERLEKLDLLSDKTDGDVPPDKIDDDNGTHTGEPGAVSGTLSISDFQYSYVDGGFYSEHNEGAIGGMGLEFVVEGPAEVKDVWIWTWTTIGFGVDEIPSLISGATDIWKAESNGEIFSENVPFQSNIGFPVWDDDRGTTVDVLLIGIDENVNAVGYAVVTVEIP